MYGQKLKVPIISSSKYLRTIKNLKAILFSIYNVIKRYENNRYENIFTENFKWYHITPVVTFSSNICIF